MEHQDRKSTVITEVSGIGRYDVRPSDFEKLTKGVERIGYPNGVDTRY